MMVYREPNQVQWLGVRPAHNGVQIFEHGGQIGAGTNTLYTVPVDKILFVTFAQIGSRLVADQDCKAYLSVDPREVGALRRVLDHYYDKAGHQATSGTFNPPIEIEAGGTVKINSDHADLDVRGSFHGFLEDV